MAFRRAFLGFILIGLLAGALNAMQNATVLNSANLARWSSSNSAGSQATEGGNISNVNITGIAQLTEKWAAFFGNVTGGSIVLREAVTDANVYTWSYSVANTTGKVCVSNSSSFPTGTMQAAVPADVNTLWGLGSSADNATATFTLNGTGLMNISGTAISCAVTPCAVTDLSNFTTVAVYNGTNTNANN